MEQKREEEQAADKGLESGQKEWRVVVGQVFERDGVARSADHREEFTEVAEHRVGSVCACVAGQTQPAGAENRQP